MSELIRAVIDGVPVEVPQGTTIIEAAKQAGVLIPHYCYHPSLSAPAVCRMCLVEVEKAPKLMPACVTAVTADQVVHVHSEAARKAREGVLELLLINHPLDCPICDQAGECELQDFVFQEGRAGTRYREYPKRFNPVEDFGRDVLYVPNRCILCTRCVRFMDEVAGAPVLNVEERGDRATIGIVSDQRLDHPWAGNVVDLCPVGSLISKDFLHKARAWDLDKTASVCPGCSQGCNIMIDTRDDVVVRFRPRPNLDVNRHFICDTGRADYRWLNRGDRVEQPLGRDAAGGLTALSWDAATECLAGLVGAAAGPVVVLASGRASVEALGWVARLVDRGAGPVVLAAKVPAGDSAPLPGIPGLALRSERAPNETGARILGYDATWDQAIAASAGAALTLLVDVELTVAEQATVARSRAVVEVASVARADAGERPPALILPATTFAEEEGTWINRDGRAQRFLQARSAPGLARPVWWIAAAAHGLLEPAIGAPATAAEAFDALAGTVPALAGLSHEALGLLGRTVAVPALAGSAA